MRKFTAICAHSCPPPTLEMETRVDVGGFVTVSLEESEDRFPSKHSAQSWKTSKKERKETAAEKTRSKESRWVFVEKYFLCRCGRSQGAEVMEIKKALLVLLSGYRKKKSLTNRKTAAEIDSLIGFSLTPAIHFITLCHKSSTTTLSSEGGGGRRNDGTVSNHRTDK